MMNLVEKYTADEAVDQRRWRRRHRVRRRRWRDRRRTVGIWTAFGGKLDTELQGIVDGIGGGGGGAGDGGGAG